MKYIIGFVILTLLVGCTSSIPTRDGDRPQTSEAPMNTNIAHQQLTQNSPIAIQKQLWTRMQQLPGVNTGSTLVSVAGAKPLFHNDHGDKPTMDGDERVHLHPEYDGSLHISLTPALMQEVVDKGRGEYHPRSSGTIMIYGPRDESELEIIKNIIERWY